MRSPPSRTMPWWWSTASGCPSWRTPLPPMRAACGLSPSCITRWPRRPVSPRRGAAARRSRGGAAAAVLRRPLPEPRNRRSGRALRRSTPDRIAVVPAGDRAAAVIRRIDAAIGFADCCASPASSHARAISCSIGALARLRDLDWRLLCVGSLRAGPADGAFGAADGSAAASAGASGWPASSRRERPRRRLPGGGCVRAAVVSRGLRHGLCRGDGARPAGDRDRLPAPSPKPCRAAPGCCPAGRRGGARARPCAG